MTTQETRREQIREALKSPYVRAVLDMIAASEIGDAVNNSEQGYNVAFGKDKTFDDYSAHPGKGSAYIDNSGKRRVSTAAGRYQFLEGTVKDLQKRYGFTDFSKATQDEMAVALMMDAKALPDILRGDFNTALSKLGTKWASLPTSVMGRQLHGVRSPEFVYNAYNTALKKHGEGADVIFPEMPSPVVAGVVGNAAIDAARTPRPTTTPNQTSFAIPPLPQAFNVRDMLNKRYAQRRMAIAPGPLTQETGEALTRTLFTPEPGTLVRPYPVPSRDGATLIQAMPTGTGATEPPSPPISVEWDTNPEIRVDVSSLDDAMRSLLMDPRSVPPQPVRSTGEAYLGDELLRLQAAPEDFLKVSALTLPYRDELLALIDATNVDVIG